MITTCCIHEHEQGSTQLTSYANSAIEKFPTQFSSFQIKTILQSNQLIITNPISLHMNDTPRPWIGMIKNKEKDANRKAKIPALLQQKIIDQ